MNHRLYQFSISEILTITAVLSIEFASMVQRNAALLSVFLIVGLIAGAVSRRRAFALVLLVLTLFVWVAGTNILNIQY